METPQTSICICIAQPRELARGGAYNFVELQCRLKRGIEISFLFIRNRQPFVGYFRLRIHFNRLLKLLDCFIVLPIQVQQFCHLSICALVYWIEFKVSINLRKGLSSSMHGEQKEWPAAAHVRRNNLYPLPTDSGNNRRSGSRAVQDIGTHCCPRAWPRPSTPKGSQRRGNHAFEVAP